MFAHTYVFFCHAEPPWEWPWPSPPSWWPPPPAGNKRKKDSKWDTTNIKWNRAKRRSKRAKKTKDNVIWNFFGGEFGCAVHSFAGGNGLERKERENTFGTPRKIRQKKRILNGENQSDWGGNDFFLLFSTTFFDVARCEREMTKR